ncbi:MAG TPA: hypothetical protein VLF87_03630, partial [Patescibacteria group bacterium]|nr:hypothetical protein [Patescibacteria group bacterium]
LIMSYIAPYVGVAMAEYLWQQLAQDTIIIYDDLTAHAHAYREVALMSGVSPGRDSYPGDMFYAHSGLLERAGRLESNSAHLTSIPLVHAAAGDITAYLPTNIMSITDGQWILDMDIFRNGIRPAINIGLSVTRVGGVGHNKRQKALAAQTLKLMADFRQAEEFSHFGSELALEAKHALQTGKYVFEILTQSPSDTYSFMAQQLMLDIVLNLTDGETIDVSALKLNVLDYAPKVTGDDNYEQVRDELKAKTVVELKGAPSKPPGEVPPPDASGGDKPAEAEASSDKKHDEKHDDKKDDKKESEAKPDETKPETANAEEKTPAEAKS